MSRINDLIKELCPNGMNFKSIDSVADLYYGKGNNIPKDGGDYPVYGCYGIVSSTSTFNNEDTPIVGHIGSAGKVSWGDGKHYVTYNGTICKPKNKNELNSRYLYHVLLDLHLENYVKGSQPFLSSSDFGPIKIAIPPLEIQEEIVKILDKFGELETELETELEARKSQYEFWRCQMFKHKGNSKISDLFKRVKGTPITAGKMKEIEDPDGKIRIFAGGQTAVNANLEDIPKANIIDYPCVIVQSRGLIDFVYYDKPFTFKNEMWAYTCNNQVTVKYLYYYLKNNVNYFRNNGTNLFSINKRSLPVTEKFEIYLPSLEEQEKIVNILDKFEKLISDISIGLPAEIELRKKQYEYYRNKLLSFEELNYETVA